MQIRGPIYQHFYQHWGPQYATICHLMARWQEWGKPPNPLKIGTFKEI